MELTEQVLRGLAKEAERGFDVERLRRRRGRPPLGSAAAKAFQVRLDPDLRSDLEERAREERTSPSDVVRRALRQYLQREKSQRLG